MDWGTHAAAEQGYQDAEETRLLYVAATRARNLLVISVYPDKPELSPWHPLNVHLAGAQELEPGEFHQGASGQGGALISERDLSAARSVFPGPACPLSVPGYAVAPVTALARVSKAPAGKVVGRGSSWGRVVHRVLEACARGWDFGNFKIFVTRVLTEEGRDPGELGQVLDLVAGIMKSPLGERVRQSKQRLAEVPFSLIVGAGNYGCARETVITGAIDLVFREDNGWVLVDYKTDRARDEGELAELVSYYTPQVDLYRRCWESLTGDRVSETGLYFVQMNKWILIPPCADCSI